MLRPGEALTATRADLILPRDASPGTDFALLQIKQPKTRGRAARHHAARVDPPDIIELLDLAFARYHPEQKLGPLSDGTFRRRFVTIQKAAAHLER